MPVNNEVGSQMKNDLTEADRMKLAEFLVKRLTECGWKVQLRNIYKDILQENHGQNVPKSFITDQLNARAAPLIPHCVRKEFRKLVSACLGGPRIVVLPNGQRQLREVPIRVVVKIQFDLN